MAEQVVKSAAELSRAELAARESGAVVVDIYDQVYQLRGTDPEHIERLAAVVGMNFTLLASLKIAAAMARQKSTSRPVQLP